MSNVVKVVPLFFKKTEFTKGSGSIDDPLITDLEIPEIQKWGMQLAGIEIAVETENMETGATGVKWNILVYWSLDGRNWSGPFELLPDITTNGRSIPAEFTDRTKLGPQIRLAIACENVDTSGTKKQAVVSAVAAFRFIN